MDLKKRRKNKRWIKVLITLFVVIIIVGAAFKAIKGNGNGQEIMTTNIKIGTVEDKLTETGNIELLRTVEVKSKIAGTVEQILVKEGEQVVKDQVLCVIDPDPTQTLLLFQKRSMMASSDINLKQALKEVERKRDLAASSLISDKEFEDAENAYLIAQNNYNLAKQELEIMEREIETTGAGTDERIVSSKVRAPYDGFITMRYIEEGSVVTSGISSVVAGTNLFQIGDPSTKIIKAYISEVDIGRVNVGCDVRIKLDAYPDTSFAGSIRHISPVGTLQQGRNVVTFKTEVEIIDKDPSLKPGMSCDVDVIISSFEEVLYLPVESVYEKEEGSEEDNNLTKKNIVYLKKDEELPIEKKLGIFKQLPDPLDGFEEREVSIGIKSAARIQITADFDTTTVVATDAEKLFNDLEARDKKNETDSENDNESVTVTL
ncbi:efflux RND transporter periplasmic adaptor subunit [Candidatus Latescibacterota bacterium]